MPTYKKKADFLTSEEGLRVEKVLKSMVQDVAFATEPTFSTNKERYPDSSMPFVDKHMHFLQTHPSTDPEQYLANLRLMTRLNR